MLNYTLTNKAYSPSTVETGIIQTNPPQKAEDWQNNIYNSYKTNLKAHVILNQKDRCAYCRKIIEADGKYEPLEHIVPKTFRPEWLFHPKNLLVTCDSCNNLKGTEQVLNDQYINSTDYPSLSEAFKIFHPYYDNWGDHLTYEDELFLIPINNSKGAATIKICKLYRYNVIINRAKELKLGQKSPMGKALFRLKDLKSESPDYDLLKGELINAITHFVERTTDTFQ